MASLKAGISAPVADRWSPQITIGTPVLIPEDYVADLSVRLALYRRLAEIEDEREIDGFAAELVDRFGPLPERSGAPAADRRDQGAVPARQRREDRRRAEGRRAVVPRQHLRQSGRADRLSSAKQGSRRAHAHRPEGCATTSNSCSSTTGSEPEDRLKGTAAILRRLAGIAARPRRPSFGV